MLSGTYQRTEKSSRWLFVVTRALSSDWNSTDGATTDTEIGVGGWYPAAVAVMVTGVDVMSTPLNCRIAKLLPAGMVTVAGTDTFDGSLLVSVTVTGTGLKNTAAPLNSLIR